MQLELSDLKDKLSGNKSRRPGTGGAVEMQDVSNFIRGKGKEGAGGSASGGGGMDADGGGAAGGGFGGGGSNTVEEELTQAQQQEIAGLESLRGQQDDLLE